MQRLYAYYNVSKNIGNPSNLLLTTLTEEHVEIIIGTMQDY